MLGKKRLRSQSWFSMLALCWAIPWDALGADAVAFAPAPQTVAVEVSSQVMGTSKTVLTVQVCPEPPMTRGGPIHDQAHAALRDLKMSYARLQPWFPYPKLGIAELEAPRGGETFWDFSLVDPIVLDFYVAAQGRPIVLNMPLPGWLFKGWRHRYPQDPSEIDWRYESGPDISSEFRDPTFAQTAEYFQRLAQWYIRGGFEDELGRKHISGHHLKIDYWEVLNEEEEGTGHNIEPPAATALYDAVVTKLRQVDPTMKFSALALADAQDLHYFEYFLNRKNHQPGIPLDMVSYHKYVVAEAGKTLPEWQHDMFAEADRFVETIKRIERIRNRLSPQTKTFISEFGMMWGEELKNVSAEMEGREPSYPSGNIPPEYWTLGASVFAYGYLGAIRAGVDMLAAAELVDYPHQMAGTNLLDWNTGEPNALYRVVKLLHEELPPGTKLMKTTVQSKEVEAQAFQAPESRKLLLINKTASPVLVSIANATGATAVTVDRSTGSSPPREQTLHSDDVPLGPQAVTIVSWAADTRPASPHPLPTSKRSS